MIPLNLLLKQGEQTTALLVDPNLDDERKRKLTYVVTELSRPERAADRPFLLGLKNEIVRRG